MVKRAYFTVLNFLLTWARAQDSGIDGYNINDLPDCAQTCLQNTAQSDGSCQASDIKCFCENSSFFSAVSCCIATSCSNLDQQRTINFNLNACRTINLTVPNYVGCAPFGVSGSNVPTFNTETVSTTTQSSGVSTLSTVETAAVTSFSTTKTVSSTVTANPLTGSCTSPRYLAFPEGGTVTGYPWIGCTHENLGCCPGIDPNEQNFLKNCPPGYSTTSNACCPSGYDIYYTNVGPYTPCFSPAPSSYSPLLGGETIQTSGTGDMGTVVPVIMNSDLLTYKYDLVPSTSQGLSGGAAAGIAIGIIVAVAAGAAILFFWIRKRRRAVAEANGSAIPSKPSVRDLGISQPQTMSSADPPTYPIIHELESPQPMSPGSGSRSGWGGPAMPPVSPNTPLSFFGNATSPPRSPTGGGDAPAEMLGSTWMHEHHPTFAGGVPEPNRADAELPASEPTGQTAPTDEITQTPDALTPSPVTRTESPGSREGAEII